MGLDIRNKVAVVTGAGSGIGQAVSIELARRGARAVGLVDVSAEVSALAQAINLENGREVAVPYQGNAVDPDLRVSVYDDLCERHDVVNICVPAAGITRDALSVKVNRATNTAEVYPLEMFRLVTEVDLIAPIYWALELVARMANHRLAQGLKRWDPAEGMQGAIVFIGSVSSQGNRGQIAYAASKAGLEGAAATLRKEAIYHGVRCGVIHPGFTDTPMVRALGQDYIAKHILPATQLGRLIRPAEIADAICFLVQNSAVSGELFADAGWHPSAA
jgi:NAD(P)-dependent dehydrogenase (short-subunit alcohol dehydrogenase family)